MECLFSRPNPASTPNQIHNLWSPVFTMRITRNAHPIQNSGSNAFMEKALRGQQSRSRQRSQRRQRLRRLLAAHFPSNQRREQHLAPARQRGNSRSANIESPSTTRTNHPISAISGGWST